VGWRRYHRSEQQLDEMPELTPTAALIEADSLQWIDSQDSVIALKRQSDVSRI
jgi:hypothetical protein